jgi:hypothetical protein
VAAASPSPKPADALQWLQDSEARKYDYQRRLEAAEAELAATNEPIALWKNNILAFKNPFRPPPKLSPEDAEAIKGMNGIDRVKMGEERLAEAQAAHDAAQKKLDDLKANPPQ